MKIYTSYFYKVRFMKPYMVPMSTAVWDPKWFHEFKGQGHSFVDKNGVINGLRATPFMPGPTCDNLCRGPETCNSEPSICPFLKAYAAQLDSLSFEEMVARMQKLMEVVKSLLGFSESPIPIFLFHETPTNPCSERVAFQKWLRGHGVEVEEFNEKKI